MAETTETDADELDRTCPLCGAVEPVSADVIEDAVSRGWRDDWMCTACWVKLELARGPDAGGDEPLGMLGE